MENPNTFSNWAPPFFISPRGILKGVIFWKLRESYKLSYVCTLNFGGLRVFGVLWVWKIIGNLFSKLFWCENGSKYRFFITKVNTFPILLFIFFQNKLSCFCLAFGMNIPLFHLFICRLNIFCKKENNSLSENIYTIYHWCFIKLLHLHHIILFKFYWNELKNKVFILS